MSERDWTAFGDVAQRFCGQTLRFGIAANSLNLNAGTAQYIWIDPPWSVRQSGEELVNGGDAPDPEEADYDAAWKEFRDRLAPLKDAILREVRFTGDDTTEFLFEGGLRIVAWHQAPNQDDGLWYDDWYAKHEGHGDR